MRTLALAAAVTAIISVGACQKTGKDGEYEVQKPVVGTQTDTVHTPTVETGTVRDTISVPKVEVKTDKQEVKVPRVRVRAPGQ